MSEDIIDRLFAVIESRRGGDTDKSYVAGLFVKGSAKIAEKVGEEAVETVIAAVHLAADRDGDKSPLIGESADLLFHLMVLWADAGLTPDDILAELARREGLSGIDEKNQRSE